MLSTLEFGLAFSFGALFSDMRDKFKTDRTTTVTVQSLLMGVATCFCEFSFTTLNSHELANHFINVKLK